MHIFQSLTEEESIQNHSVKATLVTDISNIKFVQKGALYKVCVKTASKITSFMNRNENITQKGKF